MAIKILPARLANQIAAGEVVERPASVVKELVENSIDSGATRIDVDIEKGGSKLIRVRDNGSGIEKDELGLALSRHATSKIHTLDDLEAILSLGFRGEALASISSVSRLTLTSRTATQSEAWSAYAEGRDMAVKLTPAAHPIGTTVEVVDLFFNTPARRKFLRTEKTEFTHIDELLKRIALSCFSVSITLRHNGKIIRQYRAAKSDIQMEKRVAAVCGTGFMDSAVKIELAHDDLKLTGWITTPEGARSQSDQQYCYVNGRMMRDKLINHAIRQSYESALRPEQFAAYVLFIEVDPHQVDVNVHPAKHEVRFHQARLVHDFIYQALSDALAQSIELIKPSVSKSAYATASDVDYAQYSVQEAPKTNVSSAGDFESYSSIQAWDASRHTSPSSRSSQSSQSRPPARSGDSSHSGRSGNNHLGYSAPSLPSALVQKKQSEAYRALFEPLASEDTEVKGKADTPTQSDEAQQRSVAESQLDRQVTSLGKSLAVIEDSYLLMQNAQGCHLVDLKKAEALKIQGQFQSVSEAPLKAQPLLIPLSIPMQGDDLTTLTQFAPQLKQLGIELQAKGKTSVMVMGVPQPLRQQNLQQLIPELLAKLKSQQNAELNLITQWITSKIVVSKPIYRLSEAIQLVSELEQIWGNYLPLHHYNWIQPVDFSTSILALKS